MVSSSMLYQRANIPRPDDEIDTQGRINAPNNWSAWQNTSYWTGNARQQRMDQFQLMAAYQHSSKALTDPFHIPPLSKGWWRGNQPRNRRNETKTCHVYHGAARVWPKLRRGYCATLSDDQRLPTHDRSHVCVWNAAHHYNMHIPVHNATLETAVDCRTQAAKMKRI